VRISFPRLLSTIIIVVGFGGVVFLFFYLDATSPEAIKAQRQLEAEFHSIPSPPGAVGFDYSTSHKLKQALVVEKFKTSLDYKEICAYYNDQLSKHGWQLIRDEPSYDWSRDLGGRTLSYKKDDYVATLEYEGERSNFGYDFAFSMSWRLP